MEGWIKLHRRILDWEWFDDDATFKVFVWLLLNANREPQTWHGVPIGRGQIMTSIEKISKATNHSVRNIRTIIDRLKSTSELTIKSTNKFSIITICSYDSYQRSESDERQAERQASRQSSDKHYINKKEKNKEYINPLYPLFDDDDADAENAQPTTNDPTPSEERKKVAPKKERFDVEAAIADEPDDIKAILQRWIDYKKKQHNFSYKSEASFKAFINNLRKLSNDDASLAAAIIDQSIANGWKGIFTLKSVKYGNDWTSNLNAAERAAKCVEMGNAIAARLWNR